MSLFKAFQASKKITLKRLQNHGALYSTLPWQISALEQAMRVIGEDWWPYGISENRLTLEMACQYSFEQGLSARLMTLEELFASETFDEFKI